MNVTEYTFLLNKPDAINEKQTRSLEKLIEEYPFFQSARAMYLKGLYNQNSYKYNTSLKYTAACTVDRTVLFEFITSENFTAIQKGLYEEKLAELLNINVVASEIVTYPISTSAVKTTVNTSYPKEVETKILEEKLEIGKPLVFSKEEKHSFQEWLQLSRFQPIERIKNPINKENHTEFDSNKKKKIDLIDKFIELNPKIKPIDKDAVNVTISIPTVPNQSYFMTETLAKVYLEQKKYQKAIQAYEILILKYPEKSSFFADRISDIKIVQQNNH